MNNKVESNAVWSNINGDEELNMSYNSNFTTNSSNKACYKCGGIIPAESEYCPHCGIKLSLECPKCQNKYSSQFSFCPKCGVNRKDFLLRQEEEFKRQEERRPMITYLVARKEGKNDIALYYNAKNANSCHIAMYKRGSKSPIYINKEYTYDFPPSGREIVNACQIAEIFPTFKNECFMDIELTAKNTSGFMDRWTVSFEAKYGWFSELEIIEIYNGDLHRFL